MDNGFLWIITARELNAHVQFICAYKVISKFASRALYAVPHVRVKSEVYFGLNFQFSLTLQDGERF